MDDLAHIRLVNAHPERNGAHNCLNLVTNKGSLVVCAHGWGETSVIFAHLEEQPQGSY